MLSVFRLSYASSLPFAIWIGRTARFQSDRADFSPPKGRRPMPNPNSYE